MIDFAFDEQNKVENARKELKDLTFKQDRLKKMLEKNLFKLEVLELETDEVISFLEKNQTAIVEAEMKLKHYENMERQRDQMNKLCQEVGNGRKREAAEVEKKIEDLKLSWEIKKFRKLVCKDRIEAHLADAQNKLSHYPWIGVYNKEDDAFAKYHHQKLQKLKGKMEQLRQMIHEDGNSASVKNSNIQTKRLCLIPTVEEASATPQPLKKIKKSPKIVQYGKEQLSDKRKPCIVGSVGAVRNVKTISGRSLITNNRI